MKLSNSMNEVVPDHQCADDDQAVQDFRARAEQARAVAHRRALSLVQNRRPVGQVRSKRPRDTGDEGIVRRSPGLEHTDPSNGCAGGVQTRERSPGELRQYRLEAAGRFRAGLVLTDTQLRTLPYYGNPRTELPGTANPKYNIYTTYSRTYILAVVNL